MANHARTVPQGQWDLPVSKAPDGRWITLREFVNKDVAVLSSTNLSKQLTLDQQAELVAERIAHRTDFKVAMIGLGIVDQERALQEIREQTAAGRTLINIELRTITRAIKRAGGENR